jgi:flagellar hook-associated protein 3 FlgL
MISSLDPSSQQFLNDLNRISDAMNTAQRQMSSGLKIAAVSDAPDQISALLEARAGLSSAQQILTNLGRQKSEVDAGEQALETAVQLFEQAQTLGAQGDTDTRTADQRATLAGQLGTIMQQMVGLAGTTVEGRFIFSGDSDQQAPYTIDLTQATPVSAYLGSSATRVAQNPNGTTFAISSTAQQIFDSTDPTTNVFTALNNLKTALANNDDTAIQSAVDALPKVDTYLNSELASYGNTQNQVAAATSYGQTLETQLQTQISNLQDADMTDAILHLTQAQTQQQAALAARAQLPRTTLFDFLR